MARDFSAQIDSWVRQSRERVESVIKDATQQVIDDAQAPVGKGGRMRVDTGFLRASGQASLSGLPTGPSRQGESATEQDANLVIGRWNPMSGIALWFGWTANYARVRESKDAFLGLAVQRWQEFVNKSVQRLRGRE